MLLEKSGAAVTSAGAAAEAFAAFEKSRPDIIISDISLPEEDGHQLLQRIRKLEMENKEPPTPAPPTGAGIRLSQTHCKASDGSDAAGGGCDAARRQRPRREWRMTYSRKRAANHAAAPTL